MTVSEMLNLIKLPVFPIEVMPENLVLATRKYIQNTINTLQARIEYSNVGDSLMNTITGEITHWSAELENEFNLRIEKLEAELAILEIT